MVVCALASIQEVEEGGSEAPGHPQLHSKLKASLGNLRLCPESKATNRNQYPCYVQPSCLINTTPQGGCTFVVQRRADILPDSPTLHYWPPFTMVQVNCFLPNMSYHVKKAYFPHILTPRT